MSPSDLGDREPVERERPATAADGEIDDAREAIRAVRRGEVDAFGRVVERYQRRLFGLTLMLTRDPAAADELAQDAFVRAFMRLDAYDDHRPFYPWLAIIAVRLSQNWLTRRARTHSHERQAGTADPDVDRVEDPLAALIADESGRRLWRSVAALPSGERAAAILYYRQELSVREIARALGVTSGTVKTLLFRARQRLRGTIAPEEEGER